MIVTGDPATGFGVETVGGGSTGVVLVTITDVGGETAALLFASAGVDAVMGAVPIGKEDTVRIATPLTMGTVPSSVVPL